VTVYAYGAISARFCRVCDDGWDPPVEEVIATHAAEVERLRQMNTEAAQMADEAQYLSYSMSYPAGGGGGGTLTATPVPELQPAAEAVRFSPEDTKGECRVLAEKEANAYLQCGWRLIATVNGRYIVNRDNDAVISDAREQVLKAERKADEWRDKCERAESELVDAQSEVGALRERCADFIAHQGAISDAYESLRVAAVRMEEDLAKVRNSIGSLKWKEIVGR